MIELRNSVSAVLPSASATGVARPLNAAGVRVTGGFWEERIRINRERTLRHGFDWLTRSGTLPNFRVAAGAGGRYRALGEDQGIVLPFLDSDVYKWLEAVGWELGRSTDPGLASAAAEAIVAIEAAQRPDGYLNTFVQVVAPGQEYRDLSWGHELYCIGHLVQAGIAWHRALGDDRLLDVALRAVESLERELGPAGREGIDGHPEIEMALVELFRTTGDRRHLDLAARMIDGRGHGLLGAGRLGAAYWQDHLPVRDASTVAGHAVRQLYLDCGVVDLATELGDANLLGAVEQRWQDMVDTRMYLTGGVGSRHRDEAFGDPFELPPDRAYAETCASIASVMLAWRLLLATGKAAYADLIERTMFNGVLGGISLDGCNFSYENPLQRRTRRAVADSGNGARTPWKVCACCPPNLMRLLSSWEQYLATAGADGIQLHQYATGELVVPGAAGPTRLAVDTDYPWNGRITVKILEGPARPWTLALRVPAWSASATVELNGGEKSTMSGPGVTAETRQWASGDTLVLTLSVEPRVTVPDDRVDAVRGCVAFERGPLVYAIESADLPAGVEIEDIGIPPDARPTVTSRDDVAPGVLGLDLPAIVKRGRPAADGEPPPVARAVPFYASANRDGDAMRVWIPQVTAPDGR